VTPGTIAVVNGKQVRITGRNPQTGKLTWVPVQQQQQPAGQ
jgi:hypothetical protein